MKKTLINAAVLLCSMFLIACSSTKKYKQRVVVEFKSVHFDLYHCYQYELERGNEFSEELDIDFEVTPKGQIVNLDLNVDENNRFYQCLKKTILSKKLNLSNQSMVKVSMPIVFELEKSTPEQDDSGSLFARLF
jgi:hypothetical protein